MSPAINTGALAFARTVPASEIQVGDIVSVFDSQGTRITHRVETIEQQGNNLAIAQLRGDANPVTDPGPYVITEADRVFFSINRLGYVAVWLSGPSGLVLGAIAVGGLLYIAFRRREASDAEEPQRDRQDIRGDSHALKAIVALATVGLTMVGVSQIGGTKAGYTDTATATSIQFGTAATFPTSPSTASCAVNFAVAVTITWPATVGSSYRLIARDASGNILGSNDYIATSTTGSMKYGSGGTTVAFPLIVGTYNIEIHGLSGTSVTPSYSGYQFSILVGLLYSCGGPISGTSALSRSAAPALAADAPSTPTTAVTSTTASSTTPTTTLAPAVTTTSTTAPSTTTSSPATTTAPQTTTATTTPTTVPPTTTTPSEVPVDAPATTNGLSAQKLSTASGTVVSVSNSSGTEVYRGPVDSDAVLHWLTGTDQLYVITTGGVTVIDTSTGVWAESPAPSELPDEIKALVP